MDRKQAEDMIESNAAECYEQLQNVLGDSHRIRHVVEHVAMRKAMDPIYNGCQLLYPLDTDERLMGDAPEVISLLLERTFRI